MTRPVSRLRPIALLLAAALLLPTGWSAAARNAAVPIPPLVPTEHGDFDHYTFALAWQPGFCGTDGGCLPDQPHDTLIGLHGLWASLPRILADRGVTDPQWWDRGCDLLHASDAEPALPASLRRTLGQVMPQIKSDLLHHEYDKHVQCFGFDPPDFFRTALALRAAVLSSRFAREIERRAGAVVTHPEVLAAFAASFHNDAPRALQLQCGTDAAGRTVLTQLWITIRRERLSRFPEPVSLTQPPEIQDNCPARFLVPAW